LLTLVQQVTRAGRTVEIETNGTRCPSAELISSGVWFNVSPKLTHAGVPGRRRVVPDALRALVDSGRATFKFVAREIADLDEIGELSARFGLAPVWVMPEGATAEAVLCRGESLAEGVIARGWSFSTRLHVLLWGEARGR
jgi:organic radical activating enzyme